MVALELRRSLDKYVDVVNGVDMGNRKAVQSRGDGKAKTGRSSLSPVDLIRR